MKKIIRYISYTVLMYFFVLGGILTTLSIRGKMHIESESFTIAGIAAIVVLGYLVLDGFNKKSKTKL